MFNGAAKLLQGPKTECQKKVILMLPSHGHGISSAEKLGTPGGFERNSARQNDMLHF
jgi:hypothetical protein